MSFRIDVSSKVRARGDDDKAKVRDALVAAGRKLLATEDASKVSLRRIAAEAGYSPGTIYTYFADSRSLYRALRKQDMEAAIVVFQGLVSAHEHPLERLRNLFVGTVDYWIGHPEHFDVLYTMPAKGVVDTSGVLFGQTPVVQQALEIYYRAVEEFFESLPRRPLATQVAADSLLAAVYGLIAFPRMTPTMSWTDTKLMGRVVINTVLEQWVAAGSSPVSDGQA